MEGMFSPWHWMVVLLILLVLFGGKKLPELGKGMGEAIRGFKEGMRGDDDAKNKTTPPQVTSGEPKPPSTN